MCQNSSSQEPTSEFQTDCRSQEWETLGELGEDNSAAFKSRNQYAIQNQGGIAVLTPRRDHNKKKNFDINSTSYCVSKVCKY